MEFCLVIISQELKDNLLCKGLINGFHSVKKAKARINVHNYSPFQEAPSFSLCFTSCAHSCAFAQEVKDSFISL